MCLLINVVRVEVLFQIQNQKTNGKKQGKGRKGAEIICWKMCDKIFATALLTIWHCHDCRTAIGEF